MKKAPLISIIVPNYNHSEFLKQRLDSIFNQTVQDFEVILLDDASKDESVKLLALYKNHPKVSHLIVNATNSGSTFKQWQKGIGLAKGEYIWIAESDDYCEPSFLEVMLKRFQKDIVLGYCATKNVDSSGSILGINTWPYAFDKQRWLNDYKNIGSIEIQNYLRYRNIIPNASAVIFRKDTIHNVTFPEVMKFCGDWYFWVEILKQGNIIYVSKPLNYFRRHEKSTRVIKDFKNEYKKFKEYFYIVLRHSKLIDRIKNIKKYDWILEEWDLERTSFGKYASFKLNMPLEFLIRYYIIKCRRLIKG